MEFERGVKLPSLEARGTRVIFAWYYWKQRLRLTGGCGVNLLHYLHVLKFKYNLLILYFLSLEEFLHGNQVIAHHVDKLLPN